MTHEQAVALRVHHLQGYYVEPEALRRAIEVIQNTRTPTPRLRNGEKNPRQAKPQEQDGVDIDAVHRRQA